MQYSKKTAAQLLGFSSVLKLNQQLRVLGIFDRNNQPATAYKSQGFFAVQQRSHPLPGYNIERHYIAVEFTETGINAISNLLKKHKETKKHG